MQSTKIITDVSLGLRFSFPTTRFDYRELDMLKREICKRDENFKFRGQKAYIDVSVEDDDLDFIERVKAVYNSIPSHENVAVYGRARIHVDTPADKKAIIVFINDSRDWKYRHKAFVYPFNNGEPIKLQGSGKSSYAIPLYERLDLTFFKSGRIVSIVVEDEVEKAPGKRIPVVSIAQLTIEAERSDEDNSIINLKKSGIKVDEKCDWIPRILREVSGPSPREFIDDVCAAMGIERPKFEDQQKNNSPVQNTTRSPKRKYNGDRTPEDEAFETDAEPAIEDGEVAEDQDAVEAVLA